MPITINKTNKNDNKEQSGSIKVAGLVKVMESKNEALRIAERKEDKVSVDKNESIFDINTLAENRVTEIGAVLEKKTTKYVANGESPYIDKSFKPIRDALALNEILKSKRPNGSNILSLFCQKSRNQRKEILEAYNSTFGENCIEIIAKSIKKRVAQIVELLAVDYETQYVTMLYELIKTKKYLHVILLLYIRTREEVKKISHLYRNQLKRSMIDDLDKFPSILRELCVYYSDLNMEEVVSKEEAIEDAKKIITNIRSKHIDFLVFLVSRRSNDYIRLVCSEFHNQTEKNVMECFKGKMKDLVYDAMRLIYDIIHDPVSAISIFMSEKMKTDSDFIYQMVVLRSEIDLHGICPIYFSLTSRTLSDDCEKYLKEEEKVTSYYLLVPFKDH